MWAFVWSDLSRPTARGDPVRWGKAYGLSNVIATGDACCKGLGEHHHELVILLHRATHTQALFYQQAGRQLQDIGKGRCNNTLTISALKDRWSD